MTNLTEQWKKGELPSGWYYVRLIRGEYRIDLYINGKNEWIDCPDKIISEVLAEVPSYDEWQQMKKWCEEFHSLPMVIENTKLKELLKESRFLLGITPYGNMSQYLTFTDVMKRIDEVLGEE